MKKYKSRYIAFHKEKKSKKHMKKNGKLLHTCT